MKKRVSCFIIYVFSISCIMAEARVDTSHLIPVIKKLSVYGFTRFDAWYNTRRNLDLRDGVLQLYPLDATNLPKKDNGVLIANHNEDVNANGQLGFSAIVTRFGFRISDVYLGKGKISGNMEVDFVGISNGQSGSTGAGTENLLRLRHAYVAIEWPKITLLCRSILGARILD